MDRKRLTNNLIILNLIVILLILISKIDFLNKLVMVVGGVIVTPILFGVFLFYILRPLFRFLCNRGINKSYSALITIGLLMLLICGILKYFGDYFVTQVLQIKEMLVNFMETEEVNIIREQFVSEDNIKSMVSSFSHEVLSYGSLVYENAKLLFDKGMMLFSNVLLVLLITYFLLRDGEQFKPKILGYTKERFKNFIGKLLNEYDEILRTYIIGQTIVAFSLATMIFIGYKIIGMPSALLLAFSTFILAFIPFVGFFMSMIIPYIVSIILGFDMVVKLSILFIVAQTLKGRVVVPFIMGRTMKIHPLTDIFLVVSGAALGGPLIAFSIVPIYTLVRYTIKEIVRDEDVKNTLIKLINKV